MKKIQLKDYEDNKLYPVTKTKCVQLPNGLTFHEYVEELDNTVDENGEPISRSNMIQRNIDTLLKHDEQLNELYDLYLEAATNTVYEQLLVEFLYEDELTEYYLSEE